MSVNHYLLPITDGELAVLMETPARLHDLVEQRSTDVQGLGEDGIAIVALTAESHEDPLAFIVSGAPVAVSGWVGKYCEAAGQDVECEVDMGYGPASYFRNCFLVDVARKLRPITTDAFAANCDVDCLEDNYVYPPGWHEEGRKEALIRSFNVYRECILATANSGRHLLMWCA